MPKLLRDNLFIFCLVLMVPAAWLLSDLGRTGGPLRTETAVQVGIFIIFLIQGLSLQTEQLARGVLRWRLHTFVQIWSFVITPLIVIGLTSVTGSWLDPTLRNGFLFLSVLPTTVSSCVIFTAAADGDVPGAIFNASLSNMLGVALVPLWCLILFSAHAQALPPMAPLLGQLATLILLPLLIGQMIRPFLVGYLLPRIKPAFRPISNGIICFAVFAAFSNSFHDAVWNDAGWAIAAQALIGALGLLLLVTWLVTLSAGRVLPERPVRIAARFCASHKTIAAGVPMATVIFQSGTGTFDLGLLLLPLLFYAPLQLVLASVLVDALRRSKPA